MKRSPLKRKTPMKRPRIRQVAPKKRTAEDGGDETYLCWIRGLPCAMCDREAPSHPHHPTGAGMALKAPDKDAFPLCLDRPGETGCHMAFHRSEGRFSGWTKRDNRTWQQEETARYQFLWRKFVDPERYGSGHQL